MQFRTRAIHVGQEADPSNGAVVPPIHLASTFVLPTANGDDAQYDYARTGSPTRHAFEAVMASLDGGARGLAFASGMAATHCSHPRTTFSRMAAHMLHCYLAAAICPNTWS